MSEKENIDHKEEQEELSMLGGCLAFLGLFMCVLLFGASLFGIFMLLYLQVKLFL